MDGGNGRRVEDWKTSRRRAFPGRARSRLPLQSRQAASPKTPHRANELHSPSSPSLAFPTIEPSVDILVFNFCHHVGLHPHGPHPSLPPLR